MHPSDRRIRGKADGHGTRATADRVPGGDDPASTATRARTAHPGTGPASPARPRPGSAPADARTRLTLDELSRRLHHGLGVDVCRVQQFTWLARHRHLTHRELAHRRPARTPGQRVEHRVTEAAL